ncbi:phosphatidylserine decarboxylase family protein [bacterium]|nr:phosphatidylserine decarboxylase family protein [bacterium]MBU1633859.1 phosphatidylserine decarboxylase family protein [bacterium]
MIARDGLRIVLPAFILAFVFLMGGFYFEQNMLTALFWVVFVFFLFSLWFFRDPERETPTGEKLIICPADGQVVEIAELDDDFVGNARRVSIFMSVFSVHVNRIPFSGTIGTIEHRDGRFLSAMKPEASFDNEHNIITLANGNFRIKFSQIAGLIARRIICRLQPSQVVTAGERFGLIMFGSRVDLILPAVVVLRVSIGDKVRAAQTIIGEIVCD